MLASARLIIGTCGVLASNEIEAFPLPEIIAVVESALINFDTITQSGFHLPFLYKLIISFGQFELNIVYQ